MESRRFQQAVRLRVFLEWIRLQFCDVGDGVFNIVRRHLPREVQCGLVRVVPDGEDGDEEVVRDELPERSNASRVPSSHQQRSILLAYPDLVAINAVQ